MKKVDVDTGEEVSHVFDENTIIYPSEPIKLLVASNDSMSEIQGNEILLDPAQWSNFAEKHQVKTILINREGFVIIHKILYLVCIVLIVYLIFR